MKIIVDKLAETLSAMVAQMKQAQCDSRCNGVAEIEFDDEIAITVELIAPGGMNLLELTETSTQAPVVTLTDNPVTIVSEENGEAVSVSVVDAFTTVSVGTKHEEKSTTSNTTPLHTLTTTRGATDSTVEVWEWEDGGGGAVTTTNGGDVEVVDNVFK